MALFLPFQARSNTLLSFLFRPYVRPFSPPFSAFLLFMAALLLVP